MFVFADIIVARKAFKYMWIFHEMSLFWTWKAHSSKDYAHLSCDIFGVLSVETAHILGKPECGYFLKKCIPYHMTPLSIHKCVKNYHQLVNLWHRFISRMSNCCVSFRNLLSNPFSCNCHLAWFSEWLQKRDLSGGNPRCHSPPRVKDVPIYELPHHEFKCTSMFQKGSLQRSGT
jgi:hypothetical protein